MSPVTMIFEPLPMRVRNIFICGTVVFWPSSRMMTALVKRPAAHVRQRDDLDDVVFHVALDLLRLHHVVEGVEQRPQVRIDLGDDVAGQEAEAFAGLDRRPDQDDLLDECLPQQLTAMPTAR